MTLIARPYQHADEQAVLALIASASTTDRTRAVSERAFRAFWATPSPEPDLNPNAEPQVESYRAGVVVTTTNGMIVGFAWWEEFQPNRLRIDGWVHPDYRHRGVGRSILQAIEADAKQHLHGTVTLAARGSPDIAGIQPLYESNGYEISSRFYFMRMAIQNRVFVPQIPDGVTFRSYQPTDLDQLVALDRVVFGESPDVKTLPADQFYRMMILSRPHDPALWVIGWSNGEMVAECLCHEDNQGEPNVGWVSTVGVNPSWRGQGLGRAVLIEGLRRLQQRGYDMAGLQVESTNALAMKLYQTIGFQLQRERLNFRKTLDT